MLRNKNKESEFDENIEMLLGIFKQREENYIEISEYWEKLSENPNMDLKDGLKMYKKTLFFESKRK